MWMRARVAGVTLLAWVLLAISAGSASAAPGPVLALGFDEGSGAVARGSSEFANDGVIEGGGLGRGWQAWWGVVV